MSEPKFQKAQAIVNFPEVEASIQKFWEENRIFEKTIESRRGGPRFTFYEGPPTANGLPHNGHVLTRVFKDVFLRYRSMRGYQVLRKGGWDTHGLPVEVEVEKELGIHGKQAIEEYGVKGFILRCMHSVFRYTAEWERMTNRVGFWVDLDDAYVTYHKTYVESVWWALSELFKQGLLYQGHKIVWWWPQGGTALSAGEVGLGYKPTDDPAVYVALELVDEPGAHLVIWTTTPWTLPSNQYVAVRPDYDYVQVADGDHKLIVAAALRETLAHKLGRDLPVEREFKGEALLGKRYRPPLDYYLDEYWDKTAELKDGGSEPLLWRVLAADFVELDQGTGLVHESPAFGEVDYDLLRKHAARFKNPTEIPLLCPVKPDGTFNEQTPDLEGQWVKDADKQVIHTLRDKGLLLHRETYRHDYPFCWRADDDPLIQYARPAWFIRTTAKIHNAIENSAAANWLPPHIGTGRFGDFLKNNVDWALSRERYWGTPLNIWINDESGKMAAPSSVNEILAKNPNAFDHFHRDKEKEPSLSDHLMVHKPWIDDVTFTEPGEPGVYRRVPEVIDCWFDSGCMPFAQWGYPHQNADKFANAFPADYITEAIDQTRGWFYSQLMISTLLFSKETQKKLGLEPREYPHPFKTCIVLGHVTDAEGKKESKSKGNYTPPEVIFDKIAQEFAVIDAEAEGIAVEPGTAVIAREDLDALDMLPGADMQVYRSDKTDAAISVKMQRAKKLPRRLIALSKQDRDALGLRPCEQGVAIKPNDVQFLASRERVTIESPTAKAPGADAFRWFFLAGNPPWSATRHSLANVRTIQKEFPLKVRNVYSFFTIYANIDGFNPATMKGRPVAERTLLDRWVLSELAIITASVPNFMDNYLAYEAAGELSRFVDGLSNWYLRRSRQRYWKSEFDADKQDAYATLYECLKTVIALAAPFVPFMAEEIYQNIVWRDDASTPESIHLCDCPPARPENIDRALSEEMAAIRNIVSLGLRVRTDHKLKVRQPLSKAEVVLPDDDLRARLGQYNHLIEEELNVHEVAFVRGDEGHVSYSVRPNFRRLGPRLGGKMPLAKKAFQSVDGSLLRSQLLSSGFAEIELDGEVLRLDPEDVEVLVEAAEHFAAAGDQTTVVVVNIDLDDKLREEGLYREILHRVQNLRKELDVEYTQRIRLSVQGSERLQRIIAANEDHFKGEVLCTELRHDQPDWNGAERRTMNVEDEEVTVLLSRA
ncbi:MAG TPA: isoleucine--tRNA ligase [Bryobacterales bacterium]|nr:isoleucine--tRNA ligase [Bryobacterales bacterium]